MRSSVNKTVMVTLMLAGAIHVHAQDVVISEFMARNDSFLTNAIGETHDWIELYNVSTGTIDLAGWHLTDDDGDLTKWTFPTFVLAPLGYGLVYASGSNTAMLAGEVHANFKLASGGEYLALVRPGGSVIEYAYSPAYPEQSSDVSYGLRPALVSKVLVAESNTYRYATPTDGSDSTNWVLNSGFDDSSWTSASGPIGYEVNGSDFDGVITQAVPNLTQTIYQRAQFTLEPGESFDVLTMLVKYADGFVAYLNGTKVLVINSPLNPDYNDPASSDRDNNDAIFFRDFNLDSFTHLLQTGTNTLAVHTLNFFANPFGSEILMSFELNAQDLLPDLSGEFRYFHSPTPGSANLLGEADFLQPVDFDPPRGFYTNPIPVTLSMNLEDFDIWYTLDATEPSTNNGIQYTGSIMVGTTTIVRARGFREGFEPSEFATHTYLFIDDIVRQISISQALVDDPVQGPLVRASLQGLPVLVLASGYTNFWDAAIGIYVNPFGKGIDWERPCSAEWINPDGTTGFQVNCGVRIYGGVGRGGPKKSFRLLFKGVYGPTKLEFDMFPEDGAVGKFDTIILRGGNNDGFTSNGLKDPYIRRTQIAMSGHGSRSTFVHLFIDDTYWGIYNPSERPDHRFGVTYFGGDPDLWDGINARYPTGETQTETWNAMKSAVASGMANVTNYQDVLGNFPDGTRDLDRVIHLNVDNHADYIMAQVWGAVGHWPTANWYANGARTNSLGWHFFCWDAEVSMAPLTGDNSFTPGSEGLQGELVASPEYRLRFADRARVHFFNDGSLTPASCIARYQQLVDEMHPGIHINHARWGGSPVGWENNQASMLNNYVSLRSPIVLQQLRNVALYPQVDAPEFSAYSGTVSNGFQLEMTASNQVYYTQDGADPRAIGGTIAGSAYGGAISITKNEWVKARARKGDGTWSALTEAFFSHDSLFAVQVSEIMPEPRGPTNVFVASAYEFVEVFNPGPAPLDLQHVTFTDGVSFAFPSMVLDPGDHAVVAADTNAFIERYGTVGITLAGEYEGTLNNQGERVEMRSGAMGPLISAFGYDNNRGWHIETQGGGHSLVPDLSLDQTDDELDHGSSWRASAYRDGSPGTADPVPIDDIVINEVVAHTDYSNAAMPEFDSNDAIELYNNSGSIINFTNWYLSDDASDLAKWPIPPTHSLGSGDWLAFDEVTGFHNPTNTGFGLDKAGEVVLVSHLPGTAQDRIADAIAFKAQEQGFSLGRYPDGTTAWFTMLPTTNAQNALPGSRVVINEIMYHPSELLEAGAGLDLEYIELFNAEAVPVSLWNASGAWRIDGGVSFAFPTNVVMPPSSYLLLVGFDPTDTSSLGVFLDAYGDTNVLALVFGPFNGQLSNEGERIALEQPVAPDQPGETVSWAIVDEVIYFDDVARPVEADGSGVPLQRTSNGPDGNLAATWTATLTASPGRPQDKIGMTAPVLGETFFVPSPLPLAVIVDDQQVVGDFAQVDFMVDGGVVGVVTQAPYTFLYTGVTNAGTVLVSSRVVDDAGTNASAGIPVEYLLLETLQPEFATDEAVRLKGNLEGNSSAEVTFYWGKSDGDTNAVAWDQGKTVGTLGAGGFLAEIGSLDSGSVYFTRAHGESGANSGWSAQSHTFSTMSFNQWSNRMHISFPGYTWSNTLHDFAALVILGTNISNFSYDDFQPGATDLRFSTTNGVGLSYEIEDWNPTDRSTIWVKVPMLSTQEQAILAYWGNANSVSVPSYVAVGGAWDDDYRAVWHAHENFVDSTAAGIVGVINGASNAQGVVAGALNFDGIDDYVDPRIFADWYGQNIDGLTVSFWMKPANANPGSPYGLDDTSGSSDLFIRPILGGNLQYAVGGATRLVNTIDVGQWQMMTLVLDNFQALAYINADPVEVIGSYTQFVPTAIPYVGMINQGSGTEFEGEMDEVRMSSVARSAAWVGASYLTAAMHDSFTAYEVLDTTDPDFDKDGLPDAWEREFLGGEGVSSGGEDTDLDGLDDMGEYVAGTAPTNAEDVFSLYTGSSDGEVDLRFDRIPPAGSYYTNLARFYAIQGACGIVSNLWSDLPDATNIPAVAVPFVYTNFLGATNPVHFYRGKVWLVPTVTN